MVDIYFAFDLADLTVPLVIDDHVDYADLSLERESFGIGRSQQGNSVKSNKAERMFV